jgi:hypothetical protein
LAPCGIERTISSIFKIDPEDRGCMFLRNVGNIDHFYTVGISQSNINAKSNLRQKGPSARRTTDLLKLNRDQLRWVVGLLTGHCHLKRHLFKLGLSDNPICERCLEEDESATHILCDCEAVAHVRFRHLGQFFTEPSDYYDAPTYKVLHFIRGVGLIKG